MRAELGRRYSAAVVRVDAGGKPRFVRAYGAVSALPGAASVACDTRFDIASLTKVFVSSVALTLVGRALTLDAPLTDRIAEWRATAHAPITLRIAQDGVAPRCEIALDPPEWKTALRFDADCPCDHQHPRVGRCRRDRGSGRVVTR